MKELESGIFLIEEAMPCEPKELQADARALQPVFPNLAQVVAVFYILCWSRERNRWIAVDEMKISRDAYDSDPKDGPLVAEGIGQLLYNEMVKKISGAITVTSKLISHIIEKQRAAII